MSKALVTGGAGFLGSHIADALTARGHDVVVFDRVQSPYLQAGQAMILGDLTDRDALSRAVEGCELVFHLAGLADLNAARSRPQETVTANILGTVNALEAARLAGVKRFVFASTVYVFSHAGGFYRCSKQACESYIEEFARSFDLPYTVVRYGSLYGPRSGPSNGVFRLLQQAIRDGYIDYVGRPDDVREYIHVEDAAALSVDILGDEFADKHVLLTGNSALQASELFTMFSEILGRPVDVRYHAAPESDSGHYSITPYRFTPRPGRKLATNHFVDMGQGLLELVETIHRDGSS